MIKKVINFCPKCGSTGPEVETELGQYNLSCRRCNFYCEIIVFDEGDWNEDIII
ncbi:MAG: hypothetical protein HPY89_12410 [Pelotomaculum sp.]|nr:hypothetical protein [Pelotomaculum sp.]